MMRESFKGSTGASYFASADRYTGVGTLFALFPDGANTWNLLENSMAVVRSLKHTVMQQDPFKRFSFTV